MLGAWSDDIRPDMKHAVSFAQEYARPVGALSADIKQVTDQEHPHTTGADVQEFPESKNKTGT
jgi:hypothetical protein